MGEDQVHTVAPCPSANVQELRLVGCIWICSGAFYPWGTGCTDLRRSFQVGLGCVSPAEARGHPRMLPGGPAIFLPPRTTALSTCGKGESTSCPCPSSGSSFSVWSFHQRMGFLG